MELSVYTPAVLALLLVGLGYWTWRAQREALRLRRRLQAAALDLENL